MLLSDINSNNTSVVQLDVNETKNGTDSDHNNSMENTLEAEISKLETTINDLEADNDLPDIGSCAYDSAEDDIFGSLMCEEGEVGDSRICIRNGLIDNAGSDNDKFSTCDNLDNIVGGILDPEEESRFVERNNGDKHTVSSELNEPDDTPNSIILNTVSHEKENESNSVIYLTDSLKSSKTSHVNDMIYSAEIKIASSEECSVHQKIAGKHKTDATFQPELKIPNEVMSNSIKSVIISNNCKEVPLRSQDWELATNDITAHLNSVNRTDTAALYTTHCDTNAEGNKTCTAEINKDRNNIITSSSLEDVEDDVTQECSQESYMKLHVSQHEDELYPEDVDNSACSFAHIEDNEPLVSSTPFKIKTDSLKRWKPMFLSHKESFLILDEFGESSNQEHFLYSYINSSVQHTSVQEDDVTHSVKPTSFIGDGSFFKVNEEDSKADVKGKGSNDTEQIHLAFHEVGDLEVVLRMSDEANNDGLQPSSVLINAASTQGPVMEARNIDTVNFETGDSETLAGVCIEQVNLDTGRDSTNSVPEGNLLVPNFPSESVDKNSLGKKPVISSKYEDYVSKNPEENFDNNNPEWELLRKLETDEERYRAVRQRWRNLIIPDPNKDLTCRNWRIRQNDNNLATSTSSTNNDAVIEQTGANGGDAPLSMQEGHCKRMLSDEQAGTKDHPRVKRPRTQPCTAVFDVKLEELRRKIQHEKQQIYNQEQLALMQLNVKQTQEMNYLQNFHYTYGIGEKMRRLYYQQRGDVAWVRKKFHDARLAVDRENLNEVHILEKACEEVRAFHKFYHGLDHDSHAGDALFLSESQLEDLWETEYLYDQYSKFYSG